MRSENDLSDITWAMTQTSERFLSAFLHFFFPNIRFGKVDLIREYAEGENRPDFYFEHKGDIYLIECKIWDRQQHFDKYIKDFDIPPNRLGYITNYPLEVKGFNVKTWTQLFQYLKAKIPSDESDESRLWNAYLVYLQKVCSIFIPTKPMNTDGMYSLYEFYQCLDSIFSCDNDLFTSCSYEKNDMQETNFGGNRTHGKPNNGLLGKYFEIDFKGHLSKKSWGWMGVYFHFEEPMICIGFRDDWGKSVYNKLIPEIDAIPKGKMYSKPYEEGEGVVWFDFTQNKRLNKLTNPNSQIKLLKSFFVEVMEIIATSFM